MRGRSLGQPNVTASCLGQHWRVRLGNGSRLDVRLQSALSPRRIAWPLARTADRTALLLHGQLRSLPHTADAIHRYLAEPLDADLFTYIVIESAAERRMLRGLKSILNRTGRICADGWLALQEIPESVQRQAQSSTDTWRAYARQFPYMTNLYAQLGNLINAFLLMTRHEQRSKVVYTVVGHIRLDIALFEPIMHNFKAALAAHCRPRWASWLPSLFVTPEPCVAIAKGADDGGYQDTWAIANRAGFEHLIQFRAALSGGLLTEAFGSLVPYAEWALMIFLKCFGTRVWRFEQLHCRMDPHGGCRYPTEMARLLHANMSMIESDPRPLCSTLAAIGRASSPRQAGQQAWTRCCRHLGPSSWTHDDVCGAWAFSIKGSFGCSLDDARYRVSHLGGEGCCAVIGCCMAVTALPGRSLGWFSTFHRTRRHAQCMAALNSTRGLSALALDIGGQLLMAQAQRDAAKAVQQRNRTKRNAIAHASHFHFRGGNPFNMNAKLVRAFGTVLQGHSTVSTLPPPLYSASR